jgi:hypothetical protein
MTMTPGSNVIVLARELDLGGYFDRPAGFPAEIGQQGLATLDMLWGSKIVRTGPGTCGHRTEMTSSQPLSRTWRWRGYDAARSSAG